MSEKFRLDCKICFQNMLNTKCVNVIIDITDSSIILWSIYKRYFQGTCIHSVAISEFPNQLTGN